ncbi:uncharacterized protein LOC109369124 [Meleagris gallopavo]|nr:uncharacterized protein LOC109369124 [Meleagris gallopavo]
MAMPESSGQGLGEARRLLDPSEMNREPYGHSPVIPAMRRIRDEDRNDHVLSHWNISWPRNVRSPRQRRLQARGDTFNNVGPVQGMPAIRPTTSQAGNWFLDSGDTQKRTVRLPVILVGSSNDSNSAASTAEGTLDARDTVVTDEGMRLPSCPCPSAPENVEEDWECDSEEDAEAEAVSITSSTSNESSGEAEATSSASSMAADPMTEEHASACEEAEDVGPQHEASAEAEEHALSSVCFRDAPEDGPGTAAAPHAASRRRMPAVIRTVLRALRRVCTCSCIRGQREERHEAANTRQLPRDV